LQPRADQVSRFRFGGALGIALDAPALEPPTLPTHALVVDDNAVLDLILVKMRAGTRTIALA
jgi:hypothetical protein